jgi:hypothetical protein
MDVSRNFLDEYEWKTFCLVKAYSEWKIKPKHGPVAFKKLISDVEVLKEQTVKQRNVAENMPIERLDSYHWYCHTDMQVYEAFFKQTIMERHQIEVDDLLVSEMSIWVNLDDPYDCKINVEYEHEGKKYSYSSK